MVVYRSTSYMNYLGLIASLTFLVRGSSDPSQQHPITAINPPKCASLPHSTNTCNLTSNSISQCTYLHCHVKWPTGCTDWWDVLDLNCLCGDLSTSTCTQACLHDLPWASYVQWTWNTCQVVPGWNGIPSSQDIGIPGDASLLSTDLQVSTPSCIATQDSQAFDACYMQTSDVRSLPVPANLDLSIDWSQEYQFDRKCFCDNFSYNNTMNRSTCASGTVSHSQALIWLNTYCGSHSNFQQQQMPSNWKDTLLVVNDTYLATSDLQSVWNSSGVHACDSTFNSFLSDCDAGMRCPRIDNCNTPVSTVNMTCFWSKFDKMEAQDSIWCAGDRTAFAKLIVWYEKHYINGTMGLPAAQLLPWAEHIFPSNLTVNGLTNKLVTDGHGCPSAVEKLGSFATVNIIMAILIPILGRRTVINKITCGVLGHSNSMTWPITGLIGVGLHLGSNAVNAKIIQSTPGFENASIRHLIFLWCTRPRLAWLVVAFVPLQAKKAMYFSVTASTLITEFILQIFGAVYMGAATNYGRLLSFYDGTTLREHGGVRGHDARIMYAGCLLWLIVFPFALMVCAWSVFGISAHLRSLSNYLVGMEATVRTQGGICRDETTDLLKLMANESLNSGRHHDGEIHQHCQYLLTQCNSLIMRWRALQVSCVPISQEMRRDRRERVREVRRREYDEQWTPAQERFDSPWFLDPRQRANENSSHAIRASADADTVKRQHTALSLQIEQNSQRLAALRRNQKTLQRQIDELKASANLVNARELNRVFNFGPFRSRQNRHSQWAPVHQLSPEDQRRLAFTRQSRDDIVFEIEQLLHVERQHGNLDVTYTQVEESWRHLAGSHNVMADSWRKVEEDRLAEAKAELRNRTFASIPAVVLAGMLITWIAQWLWWVGYVHVAQDAYCPPKLPALTAIWTTFSASGATVGASF